MNPVHVHLVLNHIPVLGTPFAGLLMAYALLTRKEELRKLALFIFVMVAMVMPAVTFSGDKAAERMKNISGVTEKSIHDHDEAANTAFAVSEILGALALVQLALYMLPYAGKIRLRAAVLTMVLSALASIWMAHTAYLGGMIRHGEELGNAPPVPVPQGTSPADSSSK